MKPCLIILTAWNLILSIIVCGLMTYQLHFLRMEKMQDTINYQWIKHLKECAK